MDLRQIQIALIELTQPTESSARLSARLLEDSSAAAQPRSLAH